MNELDELFREELRKQLEAHLEQVWAAEWSAFGDYEAYKSKRKSKFYNAFSLTIEKETGETVGRDMVKRFVNNETQTKHENLNVICKYIGYENWEGFKNKHINILQQEAEFQDYFQLDLPFQLRNIELKKKQVYSFFALLTLLFIIALTYLFANQVPVDTNSRLRLLHSSNIISPSTYFFGVDLTGVAYDTAYISFNIDPRERNKTDDQQRIYVNSPVDTLEYVVYKPEIIFAQLIVDGQNFGVIRLTTYSDDWEGFYAAYLPETDTNWEDPLALKEAFYQKGKLQYQRDYIHNTKHKGYFYSNFLKVADFGIDLADADLLFNVRSAAKYGGISCFDSSIKLRDDLGNEFDYSVKRKGCAIYIATFNRKPIKFTFEELDKLSEDLNVWTDVFLKIKDRAIVVSIRGEERATIPIPVKMGKLMQVELVFKGMGEVNVVKFADSNGHAYYEDFGAVLKE